MKVTMERTTLLKALGHVHRIVERRNTIPILSNVLIEASEGRVALKSTDLDLEATETAPADVAQAGATTVPAHVIYDIVRKLPEGAQLSLEVTGESGQLLLRSGRARFFLQSLPASDFPDLTAGACNGQLLEFFYRNSRVDSFAIQRACSTGSALPPALSNQALCLDRPFCRSDGRSSADALGALPYFGDSTLQSFDDMSRRPRFDAARAYDCRKWRGLAECGLSGAAMPLP